MRTEDHLRAAYHADLDVSRGARSGAGAAGVRFLPGSLPLGVAATPQAMLHFYII
jgi:hypothetical protein